MSHETILDFSPLNAGPTATLFSSSQKADVSLYTSENKFAKKTHLYGTTYLFRWYRPINDPILTYCVY